MMRANLAQLFRLCVMLLLAGTVAAAAQPVGPWARQLRPCSELPALERESARNIGACRDVAAIAPIVDVAPKGADTAPSIVVPVPNVVGMGFDEARTRLAGFTLRRSFRASAEPGGTVLEQQPAPPARVSAGATISVVLSDATLRPAPRVSAAEIDGVVNSAASQTRVRSTDAVVTDEARTGKAIQQGPADAAGPSNTAAPSPASDRVGVEPLVVPNVLGMTARNAQARLSRFKVQRSSRASDAPRGRVVEQIPRPSARAAAGSTIVLVVSSGPAAPVPAVALEPVAKVEAPALAATSEATADPAATNAAAATSAEPATPPPASPIPAATPAATTDAAAAPAAAPVEPATAPPPLPAPTASAATPARSERAPITFPRDTVLILIAGGLLGLAIGALLMRRRVLNRRAPAIIETIAPIPLAAAPPAFEAAVVTAPDIAFTARLEAGETSIEFTALPEIDETAPEYSRELHE